VYTSQYSDYFVKQFLPVVKLSQIPTTKPKGKGKNSNLKDRLLQLTNYDYLKLSVAPVLI
jgi:hypothetical protein